MVLIKKKNISNFQIKSYGNRRITWMDNNKKDPLTSININKELLLQKDVKPNNNHKKMKPLKSSLKKGSTISNKSLINISNVSKVTESVNFTSDDKINNSLLKNEPIRTSNSLLKNYSNLYQSTDKSSDITNSMMSNNLKQSSISTNSYLNNLSTKDSNNNIITNNENIIPPQTSSIRQNNFSMNNHNPQLRSLSAGGENEFKKQSTK